MTSRALPAWLLGAALTGLSLSAAAQDMPNALLEFRYTAAPRAQIAIWIEDPAGNYIATVRLTEATAYRGIGNRPGASQMNSGYRWPYGRREGVLPRWAGRRAGANGGQQFHRVIFQDRVEGHASRSTSDQSVDSYYCLSFDKLASSRDELDAVTCASTFYSDKGRYLTLDDVDYGEPYEALLPPHGGGIAILPMQSKYPPRMDVTRCDSGGGACFDHADVDDFARHVRAVMPDIDVVTMATPEGFVPQSELFTVPELWPRGDYVAWVEVNVEGDYNASFDEAAYPTPGSPNNMWDSWAMNYGYPYRGQPSVVYRLPFTLGDVGAASVVVRAPEGRTSWDHWGANYGALESMDGMNDDPLAAPGSGADRMIDAGAGRIELVVETIGELPEPQDVPDPTIMMEEPTPDPNDPVEPPEDEPWMAVQDDTSDSGAQILVSDDTEVDGVVGAVRGLELGVHPNERHVHDWITIRFAAVMADEPLHEYQVRYGTEPIVDERSFLMSGREARTATESEEGATALQLPADTPAGEFIEAEMGDLRASTHFYVAVRAVDRFNRTGPISVAEITTQGRIFTTVSRCFVATAAYGSPLAAEVGVLRRFRDRLLMTHAPGRALVAAYYRHGAGWADFLRRHDDARATVRGLLDGLVRGVKQFDD